MLTSEDDCRNTTYCIVGNILHICRSGLLVHRPHRSHRRARYCSTTSSNETASLYPDSNANRLTALNIPLLTLRTDVLLAATVGADAGRCSNNRDRTSVIAVDSTSRSRLIRCGQVRGHVTLPETTSNTSCNTAID